ncbi:MAG: nucleotide sugar dehydrogenase [Chloroflexota bacterium]
MNHGHPRLSVFGLGKLGSPLAAVLAEAGYETTGYDVNPAAVAALAAGRAPVSETGLQETIDRGRDRLRATGDAREAVLASDASFIIVPTPSGPDGGFVNDWVIEAVRAIGSALREKPGRHVAVVVSTVMPGATGGPIRAALEEASGLTAGAGVGLVYSPEFVALGTVIRDTRMADLVLIGESDPESGALVEAVQRRIALGAPEVHRMSWESAEVCKLALNSYVTTKISFANTVADICQRLPGADALAVAAALGADSRIGPKYLKPAVAYGGPCFPRDNRAFAALADALGANAALARATDAVNDYQTARLLAQARALAPAGGTVAVLGMTYKPHTGVIEQSQGMRLAPALAAAGYRTLIADPQGGEAAAAALGPAAELREAAAAVGEADLVIITTPWPAFAEVPEAAWARPGGRAPVLDPWRLLAGAAAPSGAEPALAGAGDD